MSAAREIVAKHVTVDPITVEIIGAALASIAEEMGEALVRASYSSNIKERRDASTALFDMNGVTLCQAEHIPMHLGSLLDMIPYIMRKYPVETMQPGDVFIGNDGFEGGGTHLPDIVLAEPIFVDGLPTAWAVNVAHHADFYDRGHAHIYQEGLRIPPVRFYRAGEPVPDIHALVLLNCQLPHERVSDFRAQMASNRLGVQRVVGLCRKYGRDTVLAAGSALQDYAERKMRAGISTIPDGTYRFTDYFDNPESGGNLEFSTEITVAGDTMRLHFDSPPQMRTGMNMTYTALLATVYYAVKTVCDPTILPNAGLARPLTVTATAGTILNCRHPAALDARINPAQRVVDLIYGALADAIPERVTAACNGAVPALQFLGTLPDGTLWGYNETIGGGFGARHNKDGLDGVHVHMTNSSNLPVEALEIEYPLTVLRYELIRNSGGAGTWRGGMGIRRMFEADATCHVRMDITRTLTAPWGLFGGGPGGNGRVTATGEGFHGENAYFPVGTVLEVITPGGGGYGPPEKRDPEHVRRDLAEERIDADFARRHYGHVG